MSNIIYHEVMKKLFAFVMLGSNDLNKSDKFYDVVTIYLGMIAINSADKFFFSVNKFL